MRAPYLFVALAACTFPTDGVLLQDQGTPDAAVDAASPDALLCDPGAPCDGPDLDECPDDLVICNDGVASCGDTSGDDDPELCNGMNDDCDAEIDEGFALGLDCDGLDDDECDEGKTVCSDDGLDIACDDLTDTIVDTCNTLDDDCDLTADEDFDLDTDELNCGMCGNSCTNDHGATECLGGKCTPTCDDGYADCDTDPDDGCETLQDTNPSCLGASNTPNLEVDGDVTASGSLMGSTEAMLRIRLNESLASDAADITGQIELVSGAGSDFDLIVYCPTCGASGITDADDTIEVGRDDSGGSRTFDVFVEIVHDTSTTCAQWTLTVTGGVTTTNRCAN